MHTNGMQIIAKSPAKWVVGENHLENRLTHDKKEQITTNVSGQ